MTLDPFFDARLAAEALVSAFGGESPQAAVVLGSGWAPVADLLGEAEVTLPVAELPGFPTPTVPGHGGEVRLYRVGRRPVVVLLGRVHLYEGHAPWAVVHGVRTAVLAGCRTVVLTNAAGSIDPVFAVGQPVLISDHLNLTGRSSLWGPPPPEPLPGRFVDLTDAWSPRLRELVRRLEPSIGEGVYAGLHGPNYETPAEIRALRTLGAHLVGMSTVLECIAARHLGAEVLGLSLVTNLAAGLQGKALAHSEVVEAATASGDRLGRLLRRVLEALPED